MRLALPVIFILVCGLRKAMGNYHENRQFSGWNPTPYPWIPAYAGMTVERLPSFPRKRESMTQQRWSL